MKSILRGIMYLSVLSMIITGHAQSAGKEAMPSPDSLLKKSVQAIHTKNEEAIYVMKLISANGDVSVRKMKVLFKSTNDDEAKLLIKFMEPADIRGTGFLTIAEKGKSPDQWLYLPALKKSRRIKGGNSDEPFLGSDFSMGDLSVDKQDGLKYEVKGIEKVDGQDCYRVEGTPDGKVDKSNLTYSKKIYFIRKDSYLGVKGEFYNQAGQLEKVLSLLKIRKEGNRWLADAIEMKNLLTKHSTVLEYEKRDMNKIPPDHMFTVTNLERN